MDIEVIKANLETVALQKDLESVKNEFKKYVPLREFKDLAQDQKEFVVKAELNELQDDL